MNKIKNFKIKKISLYLFFLVVLLLVPISLAQEATCPQIETTYFTGDALTEVIGSSTDGTRGPNNDCTSDCGWCEVDGSGEKYRAHYVDAACPDEEYTGDWVSSGTSVAVEGCSGYEPAFRTSCELVETCDTAVDCEDGASLVFTKSLPDTLNPGQTYSFSIKTENTGTARWYHGSAYSLRQNSKLSITATAPDCSVGLDYGHICHQLFVGGSHTWSFDLTAPSTPGTYTLDMQIRHNGGWEYLYDSGETCKDEPADTIYFGQKVQHTFTVTAPAETCADKLLNQDETDVDCGGSICGACSNDKSCAINSDCVSRYCESSVCKDAPEPEGFKFASWSCYDNLVDSFGVESSCNSFDVLFENAENSCKGRCDPDTGRCGLSAFSVLGQCGVVQCNELPVEFCGQYEQCTIETYRPAWSFFLLKKDRCVDATAPGCGNNICEAGEATICPVCVTEPCPCTLGTCPQDCGTSTCTDSDGGEDFFVKGTTILDDVTEIDECEDSNILDEYYCDIDFGKEVIVSSGTYCEQGCLDGACILDEIPVSVKIVPHPDGGIYLGQTENNPGELAQLEQTMGQKAAISFGIYGESLVQGQEEVGETPLTFDVNKANELWDQGYFLQVGAFEAFPGHKPFTVDKLIQGKYDNDLRAFAQQLREFGKPMFFTTAREPNGVLANYMGGFGPDGDQGWEAGEITSLDGEFDPFQYDHPDVDEATLYAGLGNPNICDGVERLGAAQRYYHDFFVRREGIDFLSFTTMGWTILGASSREPEGTCDFENFYRSIGDRYIDWTSINMYAGAGIPGDNETTTEPLDLSIAGVITDLRIVMNKIRALAPGKPILIEELGFCGNDQAESVQKGMEELLTNNPEIKAAVFWGGKPTDAYPCMIAPNTPGGDALRNVIDNNPDKFHSCVQFSDGSTVPGTCTTQTEPKTCAEQSGNICGDEETCSGTILISSDSGVCCSQACDSQGGASIYLDSPSPVNVGQQFNVDIKVDDIVNLAAVQIDVNYDSNVLTYVDTVEGTFLKQGGASTLFLDTIDTPQPGVIKGISIARIGSGANGDGVIAIISFTAASQGNSDISFGNTIIADPDSNIISSGADGTNVIVN
jgi:hypothetical protein